VVDDEESLRTTLAANLELDGFDVVEAADGTEALELVRQRDFDLVLTDIRMPGMNGVDLFREIRQLRPRVPVVLMTAFAMEHLIQQALREGVYMVMPKPFDVEQLVLSLHAALKRPVVLVVDAANAAEVTARALEATGLPARAVASADAALELVREGTIGVCVVDLSLPGGDAADLMARIRQLDRAVVVIAISSHDVEALLRRAAVHAAAILRRPVAPADLVEAIARARARAHRP
jgi:DNA-binding NtrC family response regulator